MSLCSYIYIFYFSLIIQLTLPLASCKALTGKETVPFVRLSKTARNCSHRRDAFRWTAIYETSEYHVALRRSSSSPIYCSLNSLRDVGEYFCRPERGVVGDVRILQAGARPFTHSSWRCAVRTAGDHNRVLHVGLLLPLVFSDRKFVRITQ
jgi:hypothetical protein